MALAAASRFIGLSPCPRAPGAPDGASADMARGERAVADRVARSAVLTRFEPVTCGRHQLLPVVLPGKLGQLARRHYWLAPRSDDAVGAGFGLGQGAGEVAAAWNRLSPLRSRRPDGRRSWPSGPAVMPVGAGRAVVVPEA
jgi:hypothetical protein